MPIRIEAGTTVGYQARVNYKTHVLQKKYQYKSRLFSRSIYGWRKAKKLAIEWEAETRKELEKSGVVFGRGYNRRKSARNSSGQIGVYKSTYKHDNKLVVEWCASWMSNGKPKHKSFRVTANRTEKQAKSLATKWRRQKIEEINSQKLAK
jgi:hypothetical protein